MRAARPLAATVDEVLVSIRTSIPASPSAQRLHAERSITPSIPPVNAAQAGPRPRSGPHLYTAGRKPRSEALPLKPTPLRTKVSLTVGP
jgi:hypothetical protein